MNEAIDFLTSNTTLAYITAFLIFIITLVLVVKRLIGFVFTLILLLFAILSGLAIANHDLFREILQSFKTREVAGVQEKPDFKGQMSKAMEELKLEYEEQKTHIQAMIEAYKESVQKAKEQEAKEANTLPPAKP